MINIRYDKSNKQKVTKQSAYLSFKYNTEYISLIKQFDVRYWDSEKLEWEIPLIYLNELERNCNVRYLNNPAEDEEYKLDFSLFKTKPFKHQEEGILYGLNNDSWLLGDQQGLGKTKQIIDIAIQRKKINNLKHCLIICGINNLKYNWIDEIKIHSNEQACVLGKKKIENKAEPSLKQRIEHLKSVPQEFFWITNIETLRCTKQGKFYKSEFVDAVNELIDKKEIDLIILDEAHKAKNPLSGHGRGLLKLNNCNKIALSGTFVVNQPMDLFTPLAFINAINNNFFTFQQKYVIKDFFRKTLWLSKYERTKKNSRFQYVKKNKRFIRFTT